MKKTNAKVQPPKKCDCAPLKGEKLITCDQVISFQVLGDDKNPVADLDVILDAEFPKGNFRKELTKVIEDAVCDFLGRWFSKDKRKKQKKVRPKSPSPAHSKKETKSPAPKNANPKNPLKK